MQVGVFEDWERKRPFGPTSEITWLLKRNAPQNESLERRVSKRLERKLLFEPPLIF